MATIGQGNRRLDRYFNAVPDFNARIVALTNNDIKEAYLIAFEAIEAEIAKLYMRFYSKDPQKFRNNVSKYNRLNSLQNDIVNELRSLGVNINRDITKGIIEGYKANFYTAGYMYESTMNTGLGFSKISPQAIVAGLGQFYDFSNYKNSTRLNIAQLNNNIRTAVTQGIAQGQSIQKVARNIRRSFNRGFNGATTIARTEVLRGTSVAQVNAYDLAKEGEELAGVKMVRYWIQEHSKNPRPEHRSDRVGEEKKDGFFRVKSPSQGKVRTKSPRLSGVADVDINCHCTTGTKITKVKGGMKLDLAVDFITPQEWGSKKGINLQKHIGKIIPAQTINKKTG